MRMLKSIALGAVLAASTVCSAKDLKVLTIGNSFAESAFRFLPSVVKSVPGCKIEMERANIGGCTLERHWKEHFKAEQDPQYKPYGWGKKKRSLREILSSEKWDVVTIQQGSHESWRPETYEPYAENLIRLVRELAPQAEIVIQETWAYRPDDGRLKSWKIGQTEMYDRLTKCYRDLAEKYQLRVIPTGTAVQLTRAKTSGDEKFKPCDPAQMKTFKWPDLPRQAGDVVGQAYWGKNRKTGEMQIWIDPSHLNRRGDYLQACLWFAALYGRKTSEIKFIPAMIGKSDAAFLQACAQEALDTFPQVKK